MLRVALGAVFGASVGLFSAPQRNIVHASSAPLESSSVEAPSTSVAKGSGLDKKHTGKVQRKAITGQFRKYTLGEIIPLSHDVALLRFLLPTDEDVFNLRPCSTLQGYMKVGITAMDEIMRFYTPVTVNGTKGYFDVIVKRKPQGRMTGHLLGLHVGDTMMFRCVAFKLSYEANRFEHVGMIAGGTGFTPMLQVINHSLREGVTDRYGNPDRTKLSFLYCNRTERHILLRGMFDRLAKEYSDRFKVWYSVDAPVDRANWDGYVGYLTEQMVRDTMPPPSDDGKSIILLCGPDQLIHHAAGVPLGVTDALSRGLRHQPVAPDLANLSVVEGILGNLGYTADQVYKF